MHCRCFKNKMLEHIWHHLLWLTYGHPVSTFVPGHNLSHHRFTISLPPRDSHRLFSEFICPTLDRCAVSTSLLFSEIVTGFSGIHKHGWTHANNQDEVQVEPAEWSSVPAYCSSWCIQDGYALPLPEEYAGLFNTQFSLISVVSYYLHSKVLFGVGGHYLFFGMSGHVELMWDPHSGARVQNINLVPGIYWRNIFPLRMQAGDFYAKSCKEWTVVGVSHIALLIVDWHKFFLYV